jgi:hypothetical protein
VPEARYASEAENKTLAAALKYAKRGWPVFPLWGRDGDKCDCGDANCKQPGKHPIGTLAPHGFKNATTDAALIERWWKKHPYAGIGLATGAVSGLVVIDVDIKNKNHTGWDSLGLLEGELGELPVETRLASTPSRGRHIYFRYVEGIRSSGGKLGRGLDVKSDGGYVVAPPSHDLYRWVDGRAAVDLPPPWIAHLIALTPTGTAGATATADAADIAAALNVIPNDNESWDDWNRIGMAAWRATGGSEDGFAAFDAWSSKSSKHDPDTTHKRWDGFKTSPPTIIGAGTIFWLADRASPTWRQKNKTAAAERVAAKVAELAKLSMVDYAYARKAAAKELDNIDLKTLDAEVARVRAGTVEEVPLYEHWNVEPWPEPVDTDDLLLEIQAEIKRYIATLGDRVVVVALWVMFTWVHEYARHSPMLLVTSAEPDCGKTTLLSVISYLAWKPLTSVEISGPMLYRSIKKWSPTFIIDEADVVLEHNDDLRAVINSGWTRGQGVIRGAPETHEPEMFPTFAPKALGMKGQALPDTTLSRTIEAVLKRKLPNEEVVDFKYEDDDYLAELRSKLARWAADNGEALGRAKPKRIPGFANRLAMNWRPLLAIAELASPKAAAACVKAAQEIESAKRSDTSSLSTQLLEDIRELFDTKDKDELLTRVIIESLVDDAEKPWAQLIKGKPLTANRLATMLRPFGICSEEIHPQYGRNTPHGKGYKRAGFEEAWKRYLSRATEKPGSKARDRAPRDET